MDLLVSVLILGLFLVPLAMTRNNVIDMAGKTSILREARFLALQKAGELERVPDDDLGDGAGDFGEGHPGFSWAVRVETLKLEDVAGVKEEEEDPYGTVPDPLLGTGGEEEPAYEVLKVTLVVRYTAEEAFLEAAEEGLPDEEKKSRPLDRIVIVRYRLKELEEEDAGSTP